MYIYRLYIYMDKYRYCECVCMCEGHPPSPIYRQPLPVHIGFAGTRQLPGITVSPAVTTVCHYSNPSDGG